MRTKHTPPRVCHNTTLARGGCGSVERCADCGAISLHVGPMTMRLDLRTTEALWTMLGEALQRAPAAATSLGTTTRGLA